MSVNGLVPTVGDTIKPLYVSGDTLYASRGYQVFRSEDAGDTYEPFATCPGLRVERWMSQLSLIERLCRLGVHTFHELPDGGSLAVLRRRIAWCPPNDNRFQEVLRIERGSRPINICVTTTGQVYFGEYFSNPNRKSVHIYGSEDGENWSIVHTFPPGAIRHVHNIVEDPYRGGVWVLTGDTDNESGLWYTGDNFRTIDRVIGGSQRARAVALIPLEDGLIVPTDTPEEQNYVQHFDPENRRLTKLSLLPNSAFHAIKQKGLLIISTVAEPSQCNNSESAAVFVSESGSKWHRLIDFASDFEIIRHKSYFVDQIIRHAEIELVPGQNNTQYIFGFGRSVSFCDGRLIRWSVDDILDYLNRHKNT